MTGHSSSVAQYRAVMGSDAGIAGNYLCASIALFSALCYPNFLFLMFALVVMCRVEFITVTNLCSSHGYG